MKKQPQITENTRRKLVNSFWELYKKKEISKITIADICNNAKYERTTFYRYFIDIYDTLSQLEDDIINNIKNDVNNSKNSNNQGIFYEGLEKFTDKYGEYIVCFHEKGNINFYNKFKKLIKTDVYNYLQFDIKDEIKKEFVFEFMFSSLINSYSYWFRHKNIMTLESFVKFSNNILLNGIKPIIDYK